MASVPQATAPLLDSTHGRICCDAQCGQNGSSPKRASMMAIASLREPVIAEANAFLVRRQLAEPRQESAGSLEVSSPIPADCDVRYMGCRNKICNHSLEQTGSDEIATPGGPLSLRLGRTILPRQRIR